jgi:hypothetical protein
LDALLGFRQQHFPVFDEQRITAWQTGAVFEDERAGKGTSVSA